MIASFCVFAPPFSLVALYTCILFVFNTFAFTYQKKKLNWHLVCKSKGLDNNERSFVRS